jgi:MFS family permease
MLAMLLPSLNLTVTATALPAIAADMGDLGMLSWVASAYLVAGTVCVPIVGKLGDVWGRTRLLKASVLVFMVGSVACGLAPTPITLILSRALQGLGGGAITALTFAVIADIVSPRERGRYQGYTTMGFAIASALGPLAGGVFTDEASWRWAFLASAPPTLLAYVAIARFLPSSPARRARPSIDIAGAALLTIALVGTLGGLAIATSDTGSSLQVLGVAGLVIASTAGLVVVERRAAHPLLSPSVIGNRTFRRAGMTAFATQATLYGLLLLTPLHLQIGLGRTASQSGVLMLPLVAGLLVGSNGSGRLITKMGRYRVFPPIGTALMTVAFLVLAIAGATDSILVVGLALLGAGLGCGMTNPVLILAAQNAVPRSELGFATSGIQLFRMLGATAGSAGFGELMRSRVDHLLASDATTSLAVVDDPLQLEKLDVQMRSFVQAGVASAIAWTFIAVLVVSAISFGAAMRIDDLPLATELD